MIEERWRWEVPHTPEQLWPVLRDTARYNEVIGVPKHRVDERLDADGRVRFFGELRFGPFRLDWEDLPVNWVANRWHEHVREFTGGPFRLFSARLDLEPEPASGGTVCRYTVRLEPAGLLGRAFCRKFLADTRRKIGAVIEGAGSYVAGDIARPFAYEAPALAPDVAERVAALVEAVEASGYGHGLAGAIAQFVIDGQEVDLAAIRPLALARAWDADPRGAVEAFLAAAREGLLGTRWEILCPRCRIGKATAARLRDLPDEAHCSSCNIRYDRDYSRNVELTFHPAPGIRSVGHGHFCWLGPSSTPHVVAQVTLRGGESRTIDAVFPPGDYRARTLEAGGQVDFHWSGGPLVSVSVDSNGCSAKPGAGSPGWRNEGPATRTVVVEERAWVRDALTADRATTLQAFRDLFSAEVLRPGDDVAVEHVTFMFTDLMGSSALYNRLGDARAYHVVREHFALLVDVVRDHDGTIVKMVGDGIHAAFADPGDAARCALAIQHRAAALSARPGLEDMSIRIGLHCGPSIAVTINDRLDYYGAAVNLAARLEGRGEGGGLVVSEPFARDPAAARVLAGLRLEPGRAPLKGFDGEVGFFRISAGTLVARARPRSDARPHV